MTKVNSKSIRGKVDNYINENITRQLPNDHILIDTGWLESNDPAAGALLIYYNSLENKKRI
jgi:hypothetical protein